MSWRGDCFDNLLGIINFSASQAGIILVTTLVKCDQRNSVRKIVNSGHRKDPWPIVLAEAKLSNILN